jgi:hypothetical protein
MTAIVILATTAMGRDSGSDVERCITRRLLQIILTPNQFERMMRHHHEGAPAVACRNCPQGGLFCSISIGRQDAVHVRPAPPTRRRPDDATTRLGHDVVERDRRVRLEDIRRYVCYGVL